MGRGTLLYLSGLGDDEVNAISDHFFKNKTIDYEIVSREQLPKDTHDNADATEPRTIQVQETTTVQIVEPICSNAAPARVSCLSPRISKLSSDHFTTWYVTRFYSEDSSSSPRDDGVPAQVKEHPDPHPEPACWNDRHPEPVLRSGLKSDDFVHGGWLLTGLD